MSSPSQKNTLSQLKPSVPPLTKLIKNKSIKYIVAIITIFLIVLGLLIIANSINPNNKNQPIEEVSLIYPESTPSVVQHASEIPYQYNPEDFPEWTSYKNQELGISFQYTENLMVNEEIIPEGTSQITLLSEGKSYVTIKVIKGYTQADISKASDPEYRTKRFLRNLEWDLNFFPHGLGGKDNKSDQVVVYSLERDGVLYLIFFELLMKAPGSSQEDILGSFILNDKLEGEGPRVHSSVRHKYSFKYPSNWYLSAYFEDNPEVVYGAHTLQSVDPDEVEKHMYHGSVDWKSFIGDKPVIKIDFAVYTKGLNPIDDLENWLQEINKNSIQLPKSDLQIGNLPTLQFKQTENLGPTEMSEANSFYAFPDENRVVWVSLYYWNVDTYSEVKQSKDWQTLREILSSFEFTK